MNQPKRRSVRQPRKPAQATAGPDADQTATPQAGHSSEGEPEPDHPASDPTGTDTRRVSMYLTAAQFTDAKAAYLADRNSGSPYASFGTWIAGAIDHHARQTPAQRATTDTSPSAEPGSGKKPGRSFVIPDHTMHAIAAAMIADRQQKNHWQSQSEFCLAAIIAATNRARHYCGGTLPTPPTRLPKGKST